MIKQCFGYLRNKKGYLVFFVLIALISSGFTILMPLYSGKFLDTITQVPTKLTVIRYVIFISILALFNIITNYIFNMIKVKIKTELTYELSRDTIEHLQRISVLEYKKYNPTYLNQRIGVDSNKIWTFFLDYYINLYVQAFTLFVLIILLFILSKKIFFIAVLFIPLYILSYLWAKNPLFKSGLENKEAAAKYFQIINEQLEQFVEIKANSLYKTSLGKIYSGYKLSKIKLMKYSKTLFLVQSLDAFISMSAKVTVFLVGGFSIVDKVLTIGNYVILNSYFTMIFQCMKFFFSVGQDYQDAKNSYYRLKELSALKRETRVMSSLDQINSISLHNVNYKYPGSERNLFNTFSYRFERGKIYVIRGENGTGKSSLILLVLGLLNDYCGEIEYADSDIKKLDILSLREKSISSYIQNAHFSDESVIQVIEFYTGISDIKLNTNPISKLFDNDIFNLNHILTIPMSQLSGGERQKVLILCVLLRETEVIFLDEPTSNLDTISSKTLHRYLESISREHLIIIVNHEKKTYLKPEYYEYLEI